MIRLAAAVSLLALLSWLVPFAQDDSVPEHFRYDAAELFPPAWRLSADGAHDPGIAMDGETTWRTWLEYVPGKGDRIRLEWQTSDGKGELDDASFAPSGQRSRPTLTLGSGHLWLTYEERAERGDWDIIVRRVSREFGVEPGRAIDTPETNEIHHVAVAQGDRLWIAAQRCVGGSYCVDITSVGDDDKEQVWVTISDREGAWEPALAASPDGRLAVAWDLMTDEGSAIRTRVGNGDTWEAPIELTRTNRYAGRPSVDFDSAGRLWIAWEEGAEGWGRTYRGNARVWNNATVSSGPLHRLRTLQLRALERDGQVREPKDAIPMPSFVDLSKLEDRRPNADGFGVYYERPQVVVDGLDRPWLVYRHYVETQLGCREAVVHHIESGFRLHALCLTDEGWSARHGFDIGQRDGSQRMSVTATRDGIAAVWETGRTDRRPDERERGVYGGAGRLEGQPIENIALGEGRPAEAAPLIRARDSRSMAVTTVGGKTFELVMGDLHRHTDLSLCFPFYDGSLDDVYRYAFEVAGLDFLGVTDHTRDIDRGNVESLLWWRCLKKVTQHHVPGRFHPFFAYERSHGDTDHNVISLRDDMLQNFPPPLPEFWKAIDDDQTFTIPHATPNAQDEPYNGKIWDYQDDAKRPLLEIYQGFRQSESLVPAQVPLKKGYHLGFIASSDHLSTSSSYAATWTPKQDRESIFRSLQARRTYGATAPIRLVFRAGDHWMGERFEATEPVTLRLEVIGTAPLKSATLWIDGSPAHDFDTSEPASLLEVDHEWSVPADEQEHYAFVRIEQTDGNLAWSSPIWVTRR
ncbi:MAG: hypothetical protein RL885_07450 [Planctomycetota bacterium]